MRRRPAREPAPHQGGRPASTRRRDRGWRATPRRPPTTPPTTPPPAGPRRPPTTPPPAGPRRPPSTPAPPAGPRRPRGPEGGGPGQSAATTRTGAPRVVVHVERVRRRIDLQTGEEIIEHLEVGEPEVLSRGQPVAGTYGSGPVRYDVSGGRVQRRVHRRARPGRRITHPYLRRDEVR